MEWTKEQMEETYQQVVKKAVTDEEFRKEDNITEEIPDEFELCNPTIHNWIRFSNNRATMKKLPADYPYRG